MINNFKTCLVYGKSVSVKLFLEATTSTLISMPILRNISAKIMMKCSKMYIFMASAVFLSSEFMTTSAVLTETQRKIYKKLKHM